MFHIIMEATRGDPKAHLESQLSEHSALFVSQVLQHPLWLCDLQNGFFCEVSELAR